MIVVTGASGTVGRAVLRDVARTSAAHRAVYRAAADAAQAPPGTDTAIADFADAHALRAALDGAESVFLVCSPVPDLVALESGVIAACIATGVRRIVLNSALGAGDWPKSFPSWHRAVEDRLKASGLAWCILRPNSFMQNVVTYFAPTIRTQGAFYGAMGNAATSFIDVRDLAAVATAALRDPAHDGHTYELNGPQALTHGTVAEMITRETGVPARYVDLPEAAQRAAMLEQGMPEWQVTALLELQQYYTSGHGAVLDGLLARLLGRPPRTMDQFLAEHAAAFRAAP